MCNPPSPLQPPNFQFHDPQGPIYTSPRFLPPAKVIKSKLTDAIVSHGSYLRECNVNHAIIGLRSRINEGVTIQVGRGAQRVGACPPPHALSGDLVHAQAVCWRGCLQRCLPINQLAPPPPPPPPHTHTHRRTP